MDAFISTIGELFKLRLSHGSNHYGESIHEICIPLYQREYKWEDERIKALIADISKRDKFIGNIILNKTTNSYEIVDGQQRITTCYLILLYLYNYYHGSPLEQQSIRGFLKPYNDVFVLKNHTIGDYIHEEDSKLSINISPENDIYFQTSDFKRAYCTIESSLQILTTPEAVREFKTKLLGSKVLILVNDAGTNMPIEQVFLDINEKAQLLDIEDIFKGHCFEIFDAEFHDQLRTTWVNLKKCAAGFNEFGIKSLSDYIYLFLLIHDSVKLPKRLIQGGRHYLEGKTMDETNQLLEEMVLFGNRVIAFNNSIGLSDYRFENLCENSVAYRQTRDHESLKAMSHAILTPAKPLYQKLPFLYFIYKITDNPTFYHTMSHVNLRKIISNLYIYATLFVLSSSKKSKDIIDHSIRDALLADNDQIPKLLASAKALRVTSVSEYIVNPTAKFDELATIYSISDNFISNDNWIHLIYSHETNYNLEHFIIPDLRSAQVVWNRNDRRFKIPLPSDFAKENKKKTINFLIMDHDLNESLENFDIVTKISRIKAWYEARNAAIPKHIGVFIQHIESMPQYSALQSIEESTSTESIIAAYLSFINAYFKEDLELQLLNNLKNMFSHSFQN